MNAKAQGTSTVQPKATYLRCSQFGHCSKVSVPAPESQKNARLRVVVFMIVALSPIYAKNSTNYTKNWRMVKKRRWNELIRRACRAVALA